MWKQISGYENVYEINENGDLRRVGSKNLIKKQVRKDGYLQYQLSYQGKRKSKKIHRLVAETFIPNPNNYSVVNHIDGNKKNNYYKNLEWCTATENNTHAWEIGLHKATERQRLSAQNTIKDNQKMAWEKNKRKVVCLNTQQTFDSIKEASEIMGVQRSKITLVCQGKQKSTKGLTFKYT